VTYTEIKERNGKRYYYRTRSHRVDGEVKKKRIYLGRDLSKDRIELMETEADLRLSDPEGLLTKEELEEVSGTVRNFRDLPVTTYDDRYLDFLVRFTHDSTAIEGNTLSLGDTRSLIIEGVTPSSKTMREIHEVIEHRKAFDRILLHRGKMDRKWLFELHSILMENAIDGGSGEGVGRYRKLNVALRGSDVEFPHHNEVPDRMRRLLSWYNVKGRNLHPLVAAARFHVEFEVIHPFIDGNGRLGRLLMNQILHERSFPMINIPKRSKVEYFLSLRSAHIGGDIRPFIKLLIHLLQAQDPGL
jgi:Fic family protein